MIRGLVALVVLVGGCDVVWRVDGFDPRDDANLAHTDGASVDMPTIDASCGTHNEDADGIFDLCDNCPTVANPDQADGPDGDGIGFACDPNLGPLNVDNVQLYAPFTDLAAFTPIGTINSDGDRALIQAGSLTSNATMIKPSEVTIQMLPFQAGSSTSTVAIGLAEAGIDCRVAADKCNVSGAGSACVYAVTNAATIETPITSATLPQILQLTLQRTGPTSFVCDAKAPQGDVIAVGSAPVVDSHVHIVVAGAGTARVDNLVVYGR